jgi:TolB protein
MMKIFAPGAVSSTMRKNVVLGIALLALLLSFSVLRDALAAGITVGPGSKDFPLALPKPAATDPSAAKIWEVVRRDLDMSGYFRLLDPDATIDPGGVEPGTFKIEDWRVLKAAALAKTRMSPSNEALRAEVWVYDVGSGEKIDARVFVGRNTDERYLGHKIADAILVALTGQPGLFGTRLTAVGNRTGKKEIYVMDLDGQGVIPVTANGSINLSPGWSPKGDRLVWTSYKLGNPDLFVKDLARGTTRTLSSRSGLNTGGAFSPDGSKVALTRSEAGDSDIWVIDAYTGADIQRVTKGGGIDVSPAWSPDGKSIAFASERSGGSQIYVQNLATGEARRVSFDGSMNTDPMFSPDGSKIAFVSRSGNFDVFVVGVDGRSPVRITQDQGDNEDPSWSPDGRYLAFSSTRGGKTRIWMSSADGRNQACITPDSSGWTQPSWGPSR